MTTLFRRGFVTVATFALLFSSCSMDHAEGQERGQAQEQGTPPESFTDPDDVNLALETFEPFNDQQADFEDTKEKDLGEATVTRPTQHSLRVSFKRRLIGGSSYQYRVTALNDTNGNDEEDPGETDLAPDTSFRPHRL
jgi:hypothetical protein